MMIRPALSATPGLRKRTATPGHAVVVQVPTAEWARWVAVAWLDEVWAAARYQDYEPSEAFDGNLGGSPASCQTAPCIALIPDAGRKPGISNGNLHVQRAFLKGTAVVGFSAAPQRLLPADLLRSADASLVLPPLNGRMLIEAARQVAGGSASKRFPAHLLRHVGVSDLIIAGRPGQSANDWLMRLAGLARHREAEVTTADGPTLDDLSGMDEAVRLGKEIARDLRDYAAGRIPWSACARGLLLYGGPGVGKTMFARALARSAQVPLVTGSLAEWQGTGEGHLGTLLAAMRTCFETARALAPCILFIDETDAFGDRTKFPARHRDYSIQVVNAFLEYLDGIDGREGVVVIGACNHPGRLDPAIVRSGRLDRTVEVPLPDQAALARIFRHHLRNELETADLSGAALEAVGATGADIARIVRDARRRARHENRPLVLDDLLLALRGGTETDRRSDMARRTVAVHEAGHALLAMLEDPDGVVRVTIRPGIASAGGMMMRPTEGDGIPTRGRIDATLRRMLAGRAAEEVLLGEVSGGAGGGPESDLARASLLATAAVCSLGMGHHSLLWTGHPSADKLGAVLASQPLVAEQVRQKLDEAYASAKDIVERHRHAVEAVANLLLKQGSASGAEIAALVHGKRKGAPPLAVRPRRPGRRA